jgi:hypothetical protein
MSRRRVLRVIVPFAVVLGLIGFTLIAHDLQQPDQSDQAFLSPASDEGQGARQLAERLRGQGVSVVVAGNTGEALRAARGNTPVTVFVTTPSMVHPDYLHQLVSQTRRVRVVMVAPQTDQLDSAGLEVTAHGPRWTAAAPQPGCSASYAVAGPAAAQRWQYSAFRYQPERCYDDSVLDFRAGSFTDVTLVGAPDPFRNDRAGEHGNADFARRLLARTPRVVWLDLHEREQPPPASAPPPPTEEPTDAPPPDPEDEQPAEMTPGGPGDGSEGSQGSPPPEDSLWDKLPPAVKAAILLAVLAAIALAVASARRLGTPVAEPLPVRVRAAETVRGLGGLYRRARTRSTSLATVQAAARSRLISHYGLPPETGADELAAHVARELARPEDEVRQVLTGSVPNTDEDLARAATEAQNVVREATGRRTQRGIVT